MIRVVVFLLAVGICALGVMWLADRPGEVAINWLGYRIETSVMVMILAVCVFALAAIALWSLLRFLLRVPQQLSHASRRRRERRGFSAISRGLVAIGSGDPTAAKRFAAEAERFAPNEALALLLRAQTAQLAGDRAGAAEAFQAMARRADTKLLGLRGLFIEAQRRDDAPAARLIAAEAAKAAPALPWAAQATFEFRCAEQDWEAALGVLSANYNSGLLDKAAYHRRRAVLLTARALASEDADRPVAKDLALQAVKLAPDLVPAAVLAGRLLAESGEARQASRILETAWKANPHPDLIDGFAHVRLSDSARDRLARVQKLAQHHPGHPQSAMAVAQAAIDARDFRTARAAIEPLLKAPTQRVAMLMAELERVEFGDEGRAREWIGRAVRAARDPAWTADGIVSDRWLPVSPVSGRLDAFEWRQPVAEIAPATYEAEPRDTALISEPQRDAKTDNAPPEPPIKAAPIEAAPSEPPASPRKPERAPEPVIPLLHAPDDPGPSPEPERDPDLANPVIADRRPKLFW